MKAAVDQMEKRVLSEGEFIHARDELIKSGTYFTTGHASLNVPSLKVKYLNDKAVRHWLDLNGKVVPMTAGEAARTELNRTFPSLRRVGWLPAEVRLLDARSPFHFTGSNTCEMIYIDLRSAYHQIYKCLWLDTTYPRGLYGRFPLRDVAHALRDWKAARNGVVGIVRSRFLVGFRGHERIEMQIRNKFLSPGLWATVQDTLHWIAHEAIERGAVYVNTDGYLFPLEASDFEGFLSFLDDHSLRWKVRSQGFGVIKAWNSYKVGGFETAPYRFGMSSNNTNKEFTNVKRPEGLRKWGEYRKRVYRLVRSGEGKG